MRAPLGTVTLAFLVAGVLALETAAGAAGQRGTTTPQPPAGARGGGDREPPPGTGTVLAEVPRLVVLLVIDQFRADYLDTYGGQWTRGLRRLLDTGAVYPRTTLPYALTRTCTGHASIATGTRPATHGIIDNEWYDAVDHRYVGCTMDPSVSSVAFGAGRATERHSAAALRVPTLADELLRQHDSARVVALALKARSAVTLGGHGGAGGRAVVAWEEDSGTWATSTIYTSTTWPEVEAFVRAHPASAARGQTWTRRLPAAAYRHADDAPGEPTASTFPRVLATPPGGSFVPVWDMSPWSDAHLATFGATLVERLRLGQTASPDLLAIGFSALDYVGHAFGPRSHEVQDTIIRLDETVEGLLTALDRRVGRGRYVLALTSDHGVALLPEQAMEVTGTPGGRVSLNALGTAIEIALEPALGGRRFIEAITNQGVHFLPGVLPRIRASARATAAVEAAARAVPGIGQVFWGDQLLSDRSPSGDPLLTAVRNSYVAGRSADLLYVPRPYWVVTGSGTTHGTPQGYDTDVPLLLYGAGIRPGRYTQAATPLDVAPTLARLAGVGLPRAEGRVLREALTR